MKKTILFRIAALVLILTLAACVAEPGPGQEGPPALGTNAGVPPIFYIIITWVVTALEAAGVLAILLGFIIGIFFFLQGTFRREKPIHVYRDLRERMGRAILISLEFLVAADIVNTVAVDPTLRNLAVLGVVVLIRTFLSFAIEVELHGRWPWQHKGHTEGGIEDREEQAEEEENGA